MSSAEQIQYMFNEEGKKTFAVLPIDLFNKLQEAYEEFEDIISYDKAQESKSEKIPLNQMLKEVNQERKQK